MSNRIKIITLATIFNLCFEFAFRGAQGIFLHKGLIVVLFFIYFAYFSIVEDLIRRFRPTNQQLLLVAFCFGLLPITFLTGVVFQRPLFFGLNVGNLFFINIVWWWALQTILTFYFATRLVPRDWDGPPMGRLSWFLSIGYILAVHLGNFRNSAILPRGPGIGYLIVIILFFACLFYLRRYLPRSSRPVYVPEKSGLLDILAFGTVVVFLFLGLFVANHPVLVNGSLVSMTAVRLGTGWTIIVFVGLMIYYLFRRRQITV